MKSECPICSSSKYSVFYESEYGILPNRYLATQHMYPDSIFYNFCLIHCAGCQTVVNLNDNSDIEMFDGYVYRTPETSESIESIGALCSFIIGECDSANMDILEIGGNSGYYLNSLVTELEKRGVHSSAVLVDKVEPVSMSGSFSWINDFLTDESVVAHEIESQFDLVIARHCMAHNADATELFKNIVKTVSPNGLIYIELTDLEKILEAKNFGQFYPEHRYSFSKKSITALCEVFGLYLAATVDLRIHGGSVGYFIKPLSVGQKRSVQSKGEEAESWMSSSIMHGLHKGWLQQGVDLVKQRKKQKNLILWGCSAKAVYALNQFTCGRVDIFDRVWDSTPEKQHLFPPGFSSRVLEEPRSASCANVVLGAPNFSRLTDRIRSEGHSIFGEFDRAY